MWGGGSSGRTIPPFVVTSSGRIVTVLGQQILGADLSSDSYRRDTDNIRQRVLDGQGREVDIGDCVIAFRA